MNNLKGEVLNVGFDGGIKLEFHGAKVTSDGGLLAHRDLDDALGLFDSVATNFHENRTGRNIQHLWTRPVGRPPKKPIVLLYDFLYQAASWDKSRLVVAKVEVHQGELFPRVGFIVTTVKDSFWIALIIIKYYIGTIIQINLN